MRSVVSPSFRSLFVVASPSLLASQIIPSGRSRLKCFSSVNFLMAPFIVPNLRFYRFIFAFFFPTSIRYDAPIPCSCAHILNLV